MNATRSEPRLTDVYVTRPIGATQGAKAPLADDPVLSRCYRLHRVEWQETRQGTDGRTAICHFRAPDAESVRIALRRAGIPFDSVTTNCPGTWGQ